MTLSNISRRRQSPAKAIYMYTNAALITIIQKIISCDQADFLGLFTLCWLYIIGEKWCANYETLPSWIHVE